MKLLGMWDSRFRGGLIVAIRLNEDETPPCGFTRPETGDVEFSTDKLVYIGPYENLPENAKAQPVEGLKF